MIDAAEIVAVRAATHHREVGRPVVIGITGAVAVGKSTFAASVATALDADGVRAEVLATDGFLHPNARLVELGLVSRKGFPESYDVGALRESLTAFRTARGDVRVPVYSHEIYDIVPDEARTLHTGDALVLEGVNVIGAAIDLLDVSVYLDAAEADIEHWYVERFHALVEEGRHDPSSFYASMAHLDAASVEDLARTTWRTINLVNLRKWVLPTRADADLVVVKGPDHATVAVREHA